MCHPYLPAVASGVTPLSRIFSFINALPRTGNPFKDWIVNPIKDRIRAGQLHREELLRRAVDASLVSYLEQHQGSAKYLVAVTGSQQSAPIILQTGKAVVTIGGFSGSDDTPTASQLADMVKNGELKYILLSGNGDGGGGRGPGGGASSAITAWVQAHGTAVTSVSSTSGTLYALSA